MHKKQATAIVIGVLFLVGACNPGTQPLPFQDEIEELKTVEEDLKDCGERLKQVLSLPPDFHAPSEDIDDALSRLDAIGNDLTDLDRRAGSAMDKIVDSHLKDDSESMKPVVEALDDAQVVGQDIMDTIDVFLASASPDSIAAEFRRTVEGIRNRVEKAVVAVEFKYYRHYIPIRFVQFVDTESQVLSDEQLQRDIDTTNEIFKPAKIRFYLRANISVLGSDLTDLYYTDPNGERQQGQYTWPDEISSSPLVWPLYGPDPVYCPDFTLPESGTESRYDAQMRAGTYCCPLGEVLVYINQGKSNGGQYPWYSRIIGMSSYHMGGNTFAHEVGHYFGLPHTFPSHKHYGMDYDLARIVTPPPDDEEPLGQRIYEPHANLVNPETGQMAELSLFWDLVFKPGCASTPHLFFNSREEAAAYEAELQPIEQWKNAHMCLPFDSGCADNTSPFTRLEITVAAGCSGPAKSYDNCYFGTTAVPCVSPVKALYTEDDHAEAFSQFGSDIGKLRWNVMSYGYRLADGSEVPDGIMETPFLCASQLEQIDRVLTYDVETRYFPGQFGRRPSLRTCTSCHDLGGP